MTKSKSKSNKEVKQKKTSNQKKPAKLHKRISNGRKRTESSNYQLRPKVKKKKNVSARKNSGKNRSKQSKKHTFKKSSRHTADSFDRFWYPKRNPKRSRQKKKKIKEPKDNSNVIWIIRHLHRMDRDEPTNWRKQNRYNENILDTPLTEFGHQAARKAGLEIVNTTPNPKKILYVYTSPFTRCIQTSLEIAKTISEHTGKLVQLRIEYGLAEAIPIHLESLKILDQSLFYERVPILDFKLALPQISKDYYPYIDTKYKSLYKKSDIVTETIKDSAERIVKVMNYLTNNYKNMVICSHQVPVTISNMFLYNREYPLVYLYKINPMGKDRKDNNPKRKNCSYGILSGFQREDNRWRYIYSPDNEYYQTINI